MHLTLEDDKGVGAWMVITVDQWIDGSMSGCLDAWMAGWMDNI